MNLRWTPTAVTDMKKILDYLSATNPSAVGRLLGQVEYHTVGDLPTFPHMGRSGILPGTREFTIPDTTCILVFRFVNDVLQVLSVRDGKMWIPPSAR